MKKQQRKKKNAKKTYPLKGSGDDIFTAVKGILGMLRKGTSDQTKLDDSNQEMYELMEQHKGYLNFLLENSMCDQKYMQEIVGHVREIYGVISNRSKRKSTSKTVSYLS